jgi:hypothetical protein
MHTTGQGAAAKGNQKPWTWHTAVQADFKFEIGFERHNLLCKPSLTELCISDRQLYDRENIGALERVCGCPREIKKYSWQFFLLVTNDCKARGDFRSTYCISVQWQGVLKVYRMCQKSSYAVSCASRKRYQTTERLKQVVCNAFAK